MTDLLVAARFYLTPPAGHFWLWSEDGEVVLWQRGATIAFRKELKAVVERLAPRGLPAFDEILLLFASCRWDSAPSTDLIIAMFESDSGENGESSSWPYEAFSSIDQMWRLPADVREPLEAKALLAEVVFETRPPIVPPEVARVVVELLDTASPAGFTQRVEFLGTARTGTLRQSVDYLIRGMQRVDVEALRLRRKTGLDVPPQPAATEDDPQTTPGDLIARLSEDAELGGMARLARNLLAVTDLPRSVSDSDELPLGGVSDIGNRGTFDRLLLSELAQDDLTLSVRVALNEALYLRRESPPRNPPQRRLILIDAGLRMWGVPRVFAASVALAFAARTSKGAELSAWRAAGESLEPVDIRTREGLVKHLEALDATLHPGASIPAFVREIEQSEEPPEAVIIIEADTLDDETFVRALDESAPARLFVATVRRNGEFRLWLRTPAGRKLIREATLDLEKTLFAPIERRLQFVPLIAPQRRELPAIFHVRPFPLRLPHRIHPRSSHFDEAGNFYSVTDDGRLMLWNERDQAGQQLAEGVPTGAVFWWHISPHGIIYLVQKCSNTPPTLVVVDVAGGAVASTALNWSAGRVTGAWRDTLNSDLLVVVGSRGRKLTRFHYRSGDLVDTTIVDGAFPVRRGSPHFIMNRNDSRLRRPTPPNLPPEVIAAIYWIDGQPQFEPIETDFVPDLKYQLLSRIAPRQCFGIFRLRESGSSVAIMKNGLIVDLDKKTGRMLGEPYGNYQVLDVNPADGVLLFEGLFESPSPRIKFIAEIESGRCMQRWAPKSVMEWKVTQRLVQWNLRRNWRSVRTLGSTLVLQSAKGTYWSIQLDRTQLILKRTSIHTTGFEFKRVAGGNYGLRFAEWNDGSRIYTDRRGLLHLKSSDPGIPEVSLVLAETIVSGWCSDGRVFGHPYIIGSRSGSNPDTIFQEVIGPFVERCRSKD